jgi:hypothetical protein
MEYIGTYGNYSYNTSQSYIKAHCSKWRENGTTFYKSYDTIIAFENFKSGLVVRCNSWSTTTGKHLNWIDGGNKKARLSSEEFKKALEKVKPTEKAPDMLKTVSSVSAIFGLMCQNDVKTKNKYQKKFFDKVQGMNFPDNWESLSEEEKSKRLDGATKIGLQND